MVTTNPRSDCDPCTVSLVHKLSVRLYPDCRPNYLETSPLQKGLILLFNGRELVEEGVGFGVPVVKYADKTFFPGEATISVKNNQSSCLITKFYTLNMVSVKKIGGAGYIDDRLYSLLRRRFELLYHNHKKSQPLFNKAMELRDTLKVTTEFRRVKPRGTIAVTYAFKSNSINVHADFPNLTLYGCREVLMLNEQGSGFFQKYSDSTGAVLLGYHIGAWDRVVADSASLQSIDGQLKFSIIRQPGAKMYRGWEQTRKRFSWAGLSYSIQPSREFFDYTIDLAR